MGLKLLYKNIILSLAAMYVFSIGNCINGAAPLTMQSEQGAHKQAAPLQMIHAELIRSRSSNRIDVPADLRKAVDIIPIDLEYRVMSNKPHALKVPLSAFISVDVLINLICEYYGPHEKVIEALCMVGYSQSLVGFVGDDQVILGRMITEERADEVNCMLKNHNLLPVKNLPGKYYFLYDHDKRVLKPLLDHELKGLDYRPFQVQEGQLALQERVIDDLKSRTVQERYKNDCWQGESYAINRNVFLGQGLCDNVQSYLIKHNDHWHALDEHVDRLVRCAVWHHFGLDPFNPTCKTTQTYAAENHIFFKNVSDGPLGVVCLRRIQVKEKERGIIARVLYALKRVLSSRACGGIEVRCHEPIRNRLERGDESEIREEDQIKVCSRPLCPGSGVRLLQSQFLHWIRSD
jgi:hypothetical protein